MAERWLPIANFPDYAVSSLGRVMRCTSRTCANAASNLEWATQARNVRHAYELGLRDCHGEGNGQARLTEDDVLDLRRRALSGRRGFYATEARRLGVSETTVRHAVLGKTWGHLPVAAA